MRTFLLTLAAIAVLLVVAVATVYATGTIGTVVAALFGPHHGWDLKFKAHAPDYADPGSWAALPGMPGPASYVPAGVAPTPADPKVDVFFIHPTGYLNGADWNSPLDADSQTEENTHWMMANQASVFNGCCAVYAPRYREGSIFRYVDAKPELFEKSGAFAYADVDRAFTYFLAHYSKGRPFIIASHSQGTEHGFNLIRRRIDGTPLAQRLVAAYLIGGGITDKQVDALGTVHACASPADLHCVIHWATYGEGPMPVRTDTKDKLLCVNPLTWLRDGPLAPASLNKGAVPSSGQFQINFWGSDKPSGMQFPPLQAPLKAHTSAACRNGFLFAQDQAGTPFAALAIAGKNYHGLDYPLFAMDIRENARARVTAFLAQAPRKP
ncbi:MAG TPA: DUF3089 domain-containing protein [Rhizomicrobium sp.]